jgi:hypothetical protein
VTAWQTYTSQSANIEDPRTQDPSNGGTSPQGYANVSSGCADVTLPSIYWSFNSISQTLFFRWRTQQQPNTFATGPNPGTYSTSDPWSSALWTVLIDTDGDGYREFAVHLNGSSGDPSNAIDRLVSIYGNTPSQSIDYINDPANIHLLKHNPTAFVDQPTNRILNFHDNLTPTADWPNGSNETLWDYGTTRSVKDTSGGCDEYYIDYQIPLAFLDATSVGGPKLTADSPMALAFATASSL